MRTFDPLPRDIQEQARWGRLLKRPGLGRAASGNGYGEVRSLSSTSPKTMKVFIQGLCGLADSPETCLTTTALPGIRLLVLRASELRRLLKVLLPLLLLGLESMHLFHELS